MQPVTPHVAASKAVSEKSWDDKSSATELDSRYGGKEDFYYGLSREEMLPFVPEGCRRLLDVGCGTGGFASLVKNRDGAEAWGVEMMPEEASKASRRLDRVFSGRIEEVLSELPPNYFDCVVFNDVLEHLPDPGHVLRQVRSVLAPGGSVVVSVPNIRYWRSLVHIVVERDFKYVNWGIFDETHLRCFTALSLCRLFEDAGYEVARQSGINEVAPARVTHRMAYRVLTGLGRRWFADCKYVQQACVGVIAH